MRPENTYTLNFLQGAKARMSNQDTLLVKSAVQTPLAPTDGEQPYWQVATSANTRKAYQSDIRHFMAAGGFLPTTTESILHYLNSHAKLVNSRTLKRRLVAIKHWHIYQNFPDPTIHPLVKKTLRGIARTHGKPAEKAAVLSVEQLTALSVRLIAKSDLSTLRDNALLQIGFFGAFRRSELVAILWQHVTFAPEGVKILIPRSKTDPEGEGQICAIPYGQLPLCPVMALKQWQERSGFTEGFVFRSLRHGRCDPQRGLAPKTVSDILKHRAIECQWPDAKYYSGHSLRRGFATAASQRGASLGAIMRQGRWHHEATVHGYIEEGKYFEANAAAAVLDHATAQPVISSDLTHCYTLKSRDK
jgi:integrase